MWMLIILIFTVLQMIFISQNKNFKLAKLIFIFILSLIFGLTINHPDYISYVIIYDNIIDPAYLDSTSTEIGYKYLMLFFKTMGFDYHFVMILISFLGLSIISSSIDRYFSNKKNYWILIIYLIYPFFFDLVQIRNFIGFVLIVYSFRFLIFNKPNNSLKFILTILIGTLFHNIMWLYLPLIFVKYKKMSSL